MINSIHSSLWAMLSRATHSQRNEAPEHTGAISQEGTISTSCPSSDPVLSKPTKAKSLYTVARTVGQLKTNGRDWQGTVWMLTWEVHTAQKTQTEEHTNQQQLQQDSIRGFGLCNRLNAPCGFVPRSWTKSISVSLCITPKGPKHAKRYNKLNDVTMLNGLICRPCLILAAGRNLLDVLGPLWCAVGSLVPRSKVWAPKLPTTLTTPHHLSDLSGHFLVAIQVNFACRSLLPKQLEEIRLAF